MGDFQQRIHILQVNLPKLEDFYLLWMKRIEMKVRLGGAKQKVVIAVALVRDVPGMLDDGVAHVIRIVREPNLAQCMAKISYPKRCAIRIAGLFLHRTGVILRTRILATLVGTRRRLLWDCSRGMQRLKFDVVLAEETFAVLDTIY